MSEQAVLVLGRKIPALVLVLALIVVVLVLVLVLAVAVAVAVVLAIGVAPVALASVVVSGDFAGHKTEGLSEQQHVHKVALVAVLLEQDPGQTFETAVVHSHWNRQAGKAAVELVASQQMAQEVDDDRHKRWGPHNADLGSHCRQRH